METELEVRTIMSDATGKFCDAVRAFDPKVTLRFGKQSPLRIGQKTKVPDTKDLPARSGRMLGQRTPSPMKMGSAAKLRTRRTPRVYALPLPEGVTLGSSWPGYNTINSTNSVHSGPRLGGIVCERVERNWSVPLIWSG